MLANGSAFQIPHNFKDKWNSASIGDHALSLANQRELSRNEEVSCCSQRSRFRNRCAAGTVAVSSAGGRAVSCVVDREVDASLVPLRRHGSCAVDVRR